MAQKNDSQQNSPADVHHLPIEEEGMEDLQMNHPSTVKRHLAKKSGGKEIGRKDVVGAENKKNVKREKQTPTQRVKRKRVVWDIPTKLKILERLRTGETAGDLAREYGVGRSTISEMKATESKLREFMSQSDSDVRCRCTMRQSSDEDLDRLLYTWFTEERTKGTYITGPLIQEKAKWFHRQRHPGDTSFSASKGWLRRWCKRHGVTGSVFNLFMDNKSSGRRQRILEVSDKLEILKRLDKGEKKTKLAKEYCISETTLAAVVSARAKLMVYQKQNHPDQVAKYVPNKGSGNVDKLLFTWYQEEKRKGTSLSGPVIKEKAKWFYDNMYPGNNFKASEGWLWRWKKRNNIPVISRSENKKQEDMSSDSDEQSRVEKVQSKSRNRKVRVKVEMPITDQSENSDVETVNKKRKRVVLDIPTKLKIIERLSNGERPVDLAHEFGVGRSTITDIKLSEKKLKSFVSTNESSSCKRQTMRQPSYDDLDKALYKWYTEELEEDKKLSGNLLGEKASELYRKLYPDDSKFSVTESWLKHWKERHGLVSVRKKTHNVLGISSKLTIIDEVNKGEYPKVLAKTRGVSKATNIDLLSAEKELGEDVENCNTYEPTIWTMRDCYDVLNKSMYIWYLQERQNHSALSWPDLEAKAIWFHTQIHPNCIVPVSSNDWLEEWKANFGVHELFNQPEAIEAFKTHLSEWMRGINLQPEQLYCAEETGLFWNYLPAKVVNSAAEKDKADYESQKDEITVLACTNFSGSHKLPLSVLGKTKDPESLQLLDKTNLSVDYSHQLNGAMTCDMFTDWFKNQFAVEVEKHLLSEGLPVKAALLIRPSPAHIPPLEVKTKDGCIECVFLPMSSLSGLNPMNEGILQFLKQRFRKSLVQKLISLKSNNCSIFQELSLCDCILMLDSAWKSLTEHHILKSWEKSSLTQCFPNPGSVPDVKEDFEVDDAELSVLRQAFGVSVTKQDISEWLHCDKDARVYEILQDFDIVQSVKAMQDRDEDIQDNMCSIEDFESYSQGTLEMKEVSENSGDDTDDNLPAINSCEETLNSLRLAQYFSFPQIDETSENMSEVEKTNLSDINNTLSSIKTEPEDWDSEFSQNQIKLGQQHVNDRLDTTEDYSVVGGDDNFF